VDDPVSRLPTRPGVDPERRDAKVVAHRTPRLAAVADLVDVLQAGDCVLAHRYSSGLFDAGPGRPPDSRTSTAVGRSDPIQLTKLMQRQPESAPPFSRKARAIQSGRKRRGGEQRSPGLIPVAGFKSADGNDRPVYALSDVSAASASSIVA